MKTHIPAEMASTLLFTCSGAADVGAIADLAGRQAAREKRGTLCCTAAVSAGIEDIVAKLHTAKTIVSIDGCPNSCGRKILEANGIAPTCSIRADELGLEKGKSRVTAERVESLTDAVRAALKPRS